MPKKQSKHHNDEISNILAGVMNHSADDDSSDSSSSDNESETNAPHQSSLAALSATYASSSDDESDQEHNENKLNRLLSATMDKSHRVLHSEGHQSLANTASLIKNERHRVELNDLIQSLDDDENSDHDSDNDDAHTNIGDALLREDLKRQLSKLAQSERMYQTMNEHQMRRLEQEHTEEMLADDLSKWNKVINAFQDARNKPLIYADSSKRSHHTHEDIKIIGEFDNILSKMRKSSDGLEAANDLDISAAAAPVDTLQTKTEMIERAKQIAQKKKEMAIRNAKLARLKKIKSKEYRRRLRRRKAKEAEKQAAFVELDEDEIKEQLEEERRQLIKERVTLRHKAQTQWSKRAQRYSHASGSTLNALTQKYQLANELRKKQSALHEEDDEEVMQNLANPETREQTINQLLDDEGSKSKAHKSLLNMKFMKEAREKQKEEALNALAEMDQEEDEMQDSSSDEEYESRQLETEQTAQYGKQSFTPAPRSKKDQQSDSSDNSDDDDNDKRSSKRVALQANSFAAKQTRSTASLKEMVKEDEDSDDEQEAPKKEASSSEEENESDSSSSDDELLPNQNDVPMFLLQRMNNKKRKRDNSGAKLTRALESDDDSSSDEDEDPRSNPWLYKSNIGEDRSSKKSRTRLVQQSESDSDSSDSESDDDANIAFQQDVKKAAFAADNVQLEFEREKQRAIDENIVMPDLQSATLPGWGGEFIGEGTTWKEEFQQKQEKITEIETQLREQKAQERADTNMSHVLIRETARVPDQYLLENHRHSRNEREARIYSQLHDRAHSIPLGQEWNSAGAFTSAITPRINLIPGRKIEPISIDKAELFAQINETKHSSRRLTKDRSAHNAPQRTSAKA